MGRRVEALKRAFLDTHAAVFLATSLLHDAALITCDRRILDNAPNAVW